MTPKNRRVPPEELPDVVGSPRHRIPDDAGSEARSGVLTALSTVLGALLVIALSTTVAWAARRHVLTSPRFAVEEIVVTGSHRRSAETLTTEAGIAKGMNIFALDLERARSALLRDPWIETATLARRLPGRVMVDITEREALAIVALPETYLAARDGRVFKRLELGDPIDLPVITGLTSDAVAQDREGTRRTIVRALDLAGDYERGSLAARAPLEEIHVSNGGDLTLVVGKEAVTLALGQPPFRRKLDTATRILAELDHRGDRAGIIMLDDETRPDRVVVRTR
jgi:cell division protein FtsQ